MLVFVKKKDLVLIDAVIELFRYHLLGFQLDPILLNNDRVLAISYVHSEIRYR